MTVYFDSDAPPCRPELWTAPRIAPDVVRRKPLDRTELRGALLFSPQINKETIFVFQTSPLK